MAAITLLLKKYFVFVFFLMQETCFVCLDTEEIVCVTRGLDTLRKGVRSDLMEPTSYKEHFTCQQLSPVHDVPTLFIVSQWQSDKSEPHLIFLMYRTLLVIFLITTWVMSFEIAPSWGIYMTTWSYTICTLQGFFSFLLVVSCVVVTKLLGRRNIQRHILKLHSVYWITYSTAISTGFVISVIFWTVLFKPGKHFTPVQFFLHGTNSIVLLMDLLVVAHPVRILHFIYPFIFGFGYIIFTVAYHYYDIKRGGRGYIYKLLNWGKPGRTTGVVLGVLASIICFHMLTFALYKLKMLIHGKIYPEKSRSTESLP